MSDPIGLVAWGRRGASVSLLGTSRTLLEAAGVRVAVSVARTSEAHNHFGQRPGDVTVDVPGRRSLLPVRVDLARKAARRTVQSFVGEGVGRLLIVMPHPWDLHLVDECRRAGVEVWMVVHDVRRHPGDVWPTRLAMHRRLQAVHGIVFLSDFVARQAGVCRVPTRVTRHPILSGAIVEPPELVGTGRQPLIAFVGRIRKYKGLKMLMDAWRETPSPPGRLLVAGEGRLPRNMPEGTSVLNRWLSDAEIAGVARRADLIVCPYLEASQSGIIPMAVANGTPVVATPVGGLIEQFVPGRDGVLADSTRPSDFSNAIAVALAKSWRPGGAAYQEEANGHYVQTISSLGHDPRWDG